MQYIIKNTIRITFSYSHKNVFHNNSTRNSAKQTLSNFG